MTLRTKLPSALLLVSAALFGSACFDPVNSDAMSALGGEAPGVRRGPLHRGGEPCLVCHDGAFGDPPAFSVAGTIYQTPGDAAAAGATVSMHDSADAGYEASTNAAGNFYITPDQWTPTYPIVTVFVKSADGQFVQMKSDIGRSGSCATCHFPPAGPDSAGHVSFTSLEGGVVP